MQAIVFSPIPDVNIAKGFYISYVNNEFGIESLNLLMLNYTFRSRNRKVD
jgi:hypothetical protein